MLLCLVFSGWNKLQFLGKLLSTCTPPDKQAGATKVLAFFRASELATFMSTKNRESIKRQVLICTHTRESVKRGQPPQLIHHSPPHRSSFLATANHPSPGEGSGRVLADVRQPGAQNHEHRRAKHHLGGPPGSPVILERDFGEVGQPVTRQLGSSNSSYAELVPVLARRLRLHSALHPQACEPFSHKFWGCRAVRSRKPGTGPSNHHVRRVVELALAVDKLAGFAAVTYEYYRRTRSAATCCCAHGYLRFCAPGCFRPAKTLGPAAIPRRLRDPGVKDVS